MSASTSIGRTSGSSYTNYENFKNTVEKWKEHKNISAVVVSENGLSVEATWLNGDKRWANYTPHKDEVIVPITTLFVVPRII